MLIKNLAAREPSALGLDTYYKQYYLCLASASATIKWYFQSLCYFIQTPVILVGLVWPHVLECVICFSRLMSIFVLQNV